MYANQVPQNHRNGHERGPGGSVWAQTLSKRRREAQDHFPNPPGPKNLIKKSKKTEHVENPDFCRSKPERGSAVASAVGAVAKPERGSRVAVTTLPPGPPSIHPAKPR